MDRPDESTTPDPGRLFAQMGQSGGKGQKLNAVDRRITELVASAPALTDAQLARLRAILGGALSRLGEANTDAA